MQEIRNSHKVTVRKPEVNRPFGKPKCRWENNIKIYCKEGGCRVWIGFIWLRMGISIGLL
jgi:hypothetical protein